jgi:hypothetical protein
VAVNIGLVIFGTIYECANSYKGSHTFWKSRYPTTISVISLTSNSSELREDEQVSLISRLIMAFSARVNASKIIQTTKTSNSSIDALDGLRVLAMLFIISGHSYSFGMQWLLFSMLQLSPDYDYKRLTFLFFPLNSRKSGADPIKLENTFGNSFGKRYLFG